HVVFVCFSPFFFHAMSTTEFYTLSLHDALPILVADDNEDAAQTCAMLVELWGHEVRVAHDGPEAVAAAEAFRPAVALVDIGMPGDRKSTRLNSSHVKISYAVFCLKKKKLNHSIT